MGVTWEGVDRGDTVWHVGGQGIERAALLGPPVEDEGEVRNVGRALRGILAEAPSARALEAASQGAPLLFPSLPIHNRRLLFCGCWLYCCCWVYYLCGFVPVACLGQALQVVEKDLW